MSIFNELCRRMETLKRAETACNERGNLSMALIWHLKVKQMAKIIDSLTLEQAGEVYDRHEHIAGVMIREGVL
jgi:hypothetical protein